MAGNIWSVNSLGGFLSNEAFSEKMRVTAQPTQLFRMHVDAQAEKGEVKGGDLSLFQKIRNVDTGGGILSETSVIPKTQMSIVQSTLTITEAGNSVPFTLKLQSLSRLTVPTIIEQALRNDMSKTLNSLAWIQFSTSDWKAVVVNTATTTFSTNGTPATGAGASMSDKNFRDLIDELKKKNTPRRANGLYACIGSTNSVRGLYDFFEPKANQTTMVVAQTGEIGRYYGSVIKEESHVLSNTLNSSTHGEAVVFGGDAVREKIVIPEGIRIKFPATDYGRDLGIAWYYMGGSQLTWTYASDVEAHVIHVSST